MFRWECVYSTHIPQVLLSLAYFVRCNIFEIRSRGVNFSFLFFAQHCYITQVYNSLFICAPAEEYLGCFQCLTVANKACVNLCVQSFVWTFPFSWVYLGAESLGQSIDVCFVFPSNCQIFSQNGCTFLQFSPQNMRVPVALQPHKHWALSDNFSHSDTCEVVSPCGYNLHFLND